MIQATGSVKVDVHEFAAETVMLLTVCTHFRALFEFTTQRTDVTMVNDILIH